jgi:membrane-bound ClpP family serine protease
MNLDLSDTVRFFGIILMLIAVIFIFINILTKGFSFSIIWFGFIFIIGLGALISGFTYLRKNSTWRKKRGM